MRKFANFSFISSVMVVVALSLACNQQVTAANADINTNWPGWRGPDHNGISYEKGWNKKFLNKEDIQVWSSEIGWGYSAPSVQDDKLYIIGNTSNKDTVYCLNSKTGEEIWTFSYPCPKEDEYFGTRSSPLIENGKVYTCSRKGDLYCLNAETGDVVWNINIVSEYGVKLPSWDLSASPVIEGDMLLLNAGYSGLALNKRDGSLIWTGEEGVCGYSTPVVFTHNTGARCAAIMGKSELLIVDISDGKVLYKYPWVTEWSVNAADPIIYNNKVFISSGYRHGGALLDISGSEAVLLWENKNLGSQISSIIFKDNYLYGIDGNVGSTRAKLRCVNFNNGEVKWEEPIGSGSLIMVDNKLIILSERGKMHVVNASSSRFREYSSASVLSRICWTAPVFSDGLVYVTNARGILVCLDATK